MSKVIQVINTMISNSNKITDVVKGSTDQEEYFFLYDNNYRWSILESVEEAELYYIAYIYPKTKLSVLNLASALSFTGEESFVPYSSKDLKSQEALESFRELFNVVKSKLLGVDDIFSKILDE